VEIALERVNIYNMKLNFDGGIIFIYLLNKLLKQNALVKQLNKLPAILHSLFSSFFIICMLIYYFSN